MYIHAHTHTQVQYDRTHVYILHRTYVRMHAPMHRCRCSLSHLATHEVKDQVSSFRRLYRGGEGNAHVGAISGLGRGEGGGEVRIELMED